MHMDHAITMFLVITASTSYEVRYILCVESNGAFALSVVRDMSFPESRSSVNEAEMFIIRILAGVSYIILV